MIGVKNYAIVLKSGKGSAVGFPVALMMWDSFVMSMGIVFGKISISILTAHAIVYLRFLLRKFHFLNLFMSLMLAMEARSLPSQFVKGLIEIKKLQGGCLLFGIINTDGFVKRHWEEL